LHDHAVLNGGENQLSTDADTLAEWQGAILLAQLLAQLDPLLNFRRWLESKVNRPGMSGDSGLPRIPWSRDPGFSCHGD
jgi:hypothetical protein